MIKVSNCENLFAAFTARSLNAAQVIRDAGTIVQNDGLELSDKDIENWAVTETKRLEIQHRKNLQLITDTVEALKVMPKA